MVLAPVEPVWETSQPEEQHGFRCGRRLAEHLVSANLVIDKFLAVGKPVSIVSLDLSKAFDRDWFKLWATLASHGVSQNLVWIIQCLSWTQEGRVFFPLTPFCRDKVSGTCFTGQLPGIGTVFILASPQMCKIQGEIHFFFFSSRLFAAIGLRSGSCFTGQLPGIGTVFILASLQMCKVQGKVH